MKESDMFIPVKELLISKLGCHSVYGEVANFDVCGLLKEVEIVVEMKRGLSWKLIEQAWNAIGLADYIFVAILAPKSYSNRIAERYLKKDGIGMIWVHDNGFAEIKFWGKRHKKTRSSIKSHVLSHHELTTGGVKSGDGPTEYSITIERIKDFMRRKEWVSVDDLVNGVESHYKNPKASVASTLMAHWNTDWCEHKKEGRETYFRLKK